MIAKPISIKLTGGKSGGCASKAVELTYRRLKGALCRNRPVRSDYLDKFVWDQIVCLLEDGTLVTAYQEGLLNLEQLRQRMPELNKKSQAVESELRSLEMAAMDQTRYLQLAESLEGFRPKLRVRAKTLDVGERQQILRLLVKEILVDANSLTIRHSIPIPQISPGSSNAQPPNSVPSGTSQKPHYLLRSGSKHCSLWSTHFRFRPDPFLRYSSPQPLSNQAEYSSVSDPVLDEFAQPFVGDCSKEVTNVGIKHPVHFLPYESYPERIQRLMLASPRTEPVREPQEVLFIDLVEDRNHCVLDDLVFQGCDAQGSSSSICFGAVGSLGRLRSIRSLVYSTV